MDEIILSNNSGNLVVNQKYITPVGSVLCYAGQVVPVGWLFCNGSEVSKIQYEQLYLTIGDHYGTPLNPNNFMLPNLEQRLPLGKSSFNNLGDTSGNQTITLDVNQIPAHTHTGTTTTNGQHDHSGNIASSGLHTHSGTTSTDGTHNHTGTTSTDGTHTHSSNAIGGYGNYGLCISNGASTVQSTDSSPNELNVWTNPGALTIYNSGAHSHSLNVANNGSHSHTLNVDTNGTHTHTIDIVDNGSHNHTFTTSSVGSGSSINIMNPYIILNYIIKY